MTKPKACKLSRGAEAVRAYLNAAGDSIAVQIAGTDIYWSLTLSGLPLRARDVRELKEAGVIMSFGAEIDGKGPAACYVLAGDKAGLAASIGRARKPVAKPKRTECGADNIEACASGSFCNDCAPAGMADRVASGEAVGVPWIGAKG